MTRNNNGRSDDAGYYFGDVVDLKCETGLKFLKTNSTQLAVECRTDGSWNHTVNQCVGMSLEKVWQHHVVTLV